MKPEALAARNACKHNRIFELRPLGLGITDLPASRMFPEPAATKKPQTLLKHRVSGFFDFLVNVILRLLTAFVLVNLTVQNRQHTMRVRGNIRFVSHQNDRIALIVQPFQHLHDFF